MTALAFHNAVQTGSAHRRVVDAHAVVKAVSPVGGAACLPCPSREQPGKPFAPLQGPPMQFAGRVGSLSTPQSLFTVQGDLAVAAPILIVWPYSVPTLAGASLFERPSVRVRAGLKVYLYCKFSLSAPGVLHSQNAELRLDEADDLTTGLRLNGDTTIQVIGSFREVDGKISFKSASNISTNPYLPE